VSSVSWKPGRRALGMGKIRLSGGVENGFSSLWSGCGAGTDPWALLPGDAPWHLNPAGSARPGILRLESSLRWKPPSCCYFFFLLRLFWNSGIGVPSWWETLTQHFGAWAAPRGWFPRGSLDGERGRKPQRWEIPSAGTWDPIPLGTDGAVRFIPCVSRAAPWTGGIQPLCLIFAWKFRI